MSDRSKTSDRSSETNRGCHHIDWRARGQQSGLDLTSVHSRLQRLLAADLVSNRFVGTEGVFRYEPATLELSDLFEPGRPESDLIQGRAGMKRARVRSKVGLSDCAIKAAR